MCPAYFLLLNIKPSKSFHEFCWIFLAHGGVKGFKKRPVGMDARQNCGEQCTYIIIKSIDENKYCISKSNEQWPKREKNPTFLFAGLLYDCSHSEWYCHSGKF